MLMSYLKYQLYITEEQERIEAEAEAAAEAEAERKRQVRHFIIIRIEMHHL